MTPKAVRPTILAHRGASRRAPENTLLALSLAAELGASWVEVDARLTRDGVLVLVHDDDLSRTTQAAGLVRAHTVAEVTALRADKEHGLRFAGECVPTLEAALAQCDDLGLRMNIEIKSSAADAVESADALRDVLRPRRAPSLPAPLFSSDCAPVLARLRDTLPDVPRALIVERADASTARTFADLRCAGLVCDHTGLDAADVARMKAFLGDAPLWVYTVNEAEVAARLAAMGVAGFFTDVPDVLLAAFG